MAKQTKLRFSVYICFVIVMTQCSQISASGKTSPTSMAGVAESVSPSPVTTTASQNSNSSNKTKSEASTATTKVPTTSSSGAVNTNTSKADNTTAVLNSTGSPSSTEQARGNPSATDSPHVTPGTTDSGTESDKDNGTSGETTVTAASAPNLTSNNSNTGDNSSSAVGSTASSANISTTATPNATNATAPNTNSSTAAGASTTTVNTTSTGSPNMTVVPSKTPVTELNTTPAVASTPVAKPSTAGPNTSVSTVSTATSNVSLSTSNITSPTKPTSSNNTGTITGSVTPAIGTSNATIATPPTSPANTTLTPSGTTGTVPSTPTTPTNEKVYINEVMVNKDGGFQKIELLKSAAANMSHYAMVIVDGSSNKKEIFYLKDNTTVIQHTNGFVTISINSTLHVVQNTGTGIAVYDTNSMSNLEAKNWTLSNTGLIDALVIGKTYNITQNLLKTLTTDNNPFVIDPALYGSLKTISRCSLDNVKNTDMFMLTDSSLGKNNSDKCVAKMDVKKTLVLKFNASCDSLNSTMARDMMKIVVKEVNKGCHCGITRLHVKEITVGCCGGETWLKIQFVIPSDNKDSHLLTSYKRFIDQSPSIELAKQKYKLDKKCDNMEACCDMYNCCDQPKPLTVSDAGKNVKVTVAAVVSCLVVFLIIVVLVIMYMRRKKTVNYQFRMSRLRDDDEDLMMDGAEGDDFVGGQEATFDIKT